MISVTSLKNGTIYQDTKSADPLLVLKYSHIKISRGSATVKVKVKNLKTGSITEKTYQSNKEVQEADVKKKSAQYLYSNGGSFTFMDPGSFEQFELSQSLIGDTANLLKEGEKYTIVYFNDSPISIEMPPTVTLKVKYTEPGFKGDSATNVLKDAIAETGLKLKVPTFINIGDYVKINTQTKTYKERCIK